MPIITRTFPEVKRAISSTVGKASTRLKYEDKKPSLERLKLLIKDEVTKNKGDSDRIINTAKLAIKTIQENLNHKGTSYFINYNYYGNYETEINGEFFKSLTSSASKSLLEDICTHRNTVLGDRKLSFWGTNYTDTAIELREFLASVELQSIAQDIILEKNSENNSSMESKNIYYPVFSGEDKVSENARLLEQYKIKDQISSNLGQEVNTGFKQSGKYKQFDADTGLLRGAGNKIENEFAKEKRISDYINELEHRLSRQLKACTSFQQPLSAEQVINYKLPRNFHYAVVDLYDKSEVDTSELEVLLGDENLSLSKPQLAEIGRQIIQLLKNLYLGNIEHNDLHMHNILVHKVDNKIIVKAIDFGKSKYNSRYLFSDINYTFFKEAQGRLETYKRNHLRKSDSPKQLKHYPLHKLARQAGKAANQIDEFLNQLGKGLISDLRNNERKVEDIFNQYADEYYRWICTE